jgi:hypothetical protein
VISLATGGRHAASLARLRRSLQRVDFRGGVLFWPPGSYPPECPPRFNVPFAFKPFCFAEARSRGFELVLWLDASCLALRPLDGVFAEIEARGYLLYQNAHRKVGQWAGDAALANFGLGRREALELPEVRGAAVGLNMRDGVAAEFLQRWLEAATEGTAFRGVEGELRSSEDYWNVKWNKANRVSRDPRVRGHRHDQTVAGMLAHRLDMELKPVGFQPYRRGWIIYPGSVFVTCGSGSTGPVRVRIGLLVGKLVGVGRAFFSRLSRLR